MQKNTPIDIDAYIAGCSAEVQEILTAIRETIREEAPHTKEVISYGMPAFKQHKVLVYFAAFQNHIGFYALPSGNEAFQAELTHYKTGKGSIQFPLNAPIPFELIRLIVRFRLMEDAELGRKKK